MSTEKRAIIRSSLYMITGIIVIVGAFGLSWKATLLVLLGHFLFDSGIKLIDRELKPLSPFTPTDANTKTSYSRRTSRRRK